MATKMLQRRGDAAEWAALNPILEDGEIGYERDTKVIKIGDGVTHWNDMAVAYIPTSKINAAGDLLVGTGPNTLTRLPKGTANQRLTTLPDGTLAWTTLPAEDNPLVVIDAAGDLIVGTGPDAAARLAKGADGTYLKTAGGVVGWGAGPDLSGFETLAHAAATYETLAHAAATYETLVADAADAATRETVAHAAATFETQAHALSTFRPIAANAYAEKAADTSRNNDASNSNDPELKFGVQANALWIFEVMLLVDGGAGDLIVSMNGPAGSNLTYIGAGANNAAAASAAAGEWVGRAPSGPATTNIPFGTIAGQHVGIHIRGRIKTVATAGFCSVSWAQLTSNATPTTLLAGSWIEGRMVMA